MSTNSTPLTTRPASTSRHGITRLSARRHGSRRAVSRRAPPAPRDREAALVERLADDHAVDASGSARRAGPRAPRRSLERADPARVDQLPSRPRAPTLATAVAGRGRRACRRGRRRCRRSCRTPVARAAPRAPPRRVDARALSQPVRGDHARRARRPTRARARGRARRAPRAAARGSVNAAVPRITRVRRPPRGRASIASAERRPPPYCTGTPSLAGDRAQVLEVHRRAALRAVEVDHVQALGARLDPAARGRERVLVVDLLARRSRP